MKKNYFIIAIMGIFSQSHAQSYILLANDPAGDATQSFAPDIQSLHYAVSVAQDSIWFKVQTSNAIDPNGDAGLMFGLDTNMITTDGILWNGNNNSMKYDHAFIVFQNVISPNYYGFLYNSTGSVQIPTVVLRPDSFTFIISTSLSQLDQDGNFNLLFGSGAFDILSTRDVFDEAPNSGFITISGITGIPKTEQGNPSIRVYPNPATSTIVLCRGSKEQFNYCILSSTGAEVMNGRAFNNGRIDISGLQDGIYLIKVTGEHEIIQTAVFLKMKE